MIVLKLNALQSVFFAVGVVYLGFLIKKAVKPLETFCIPTPVIGGLLVAFLHLFLREKGLFSFQLDTSLQMPFMMAFFASIGLGARVGILVKGGKRLFLFFTLSVLLLLLQNVLGVAGALLFGRDALLGLLTGSVSLTGGVGTGAAFGGLFERSYGFRGAVEVATAAATFGIVLGSLMGGPIARFLIQRHSLKTPRGESAESQERPEEGATGDELFRVFAYLVGALVLGTLLDGVFVKWQITLPTYISAMIIASLGVNLGELFGAKPLSPGAVESLGNLSLNVFLGMALSSLKLWQLKDLALPMVVILLLQALLMVLFALTIGFCLSGRDYDGAVMSSGLCGFGFGAMPNAVANMNSLVEKYGPAPRAFFIVPIVGAFLIDFANALVITLFVNFLR